MPWASRANAETKENPAFWLMPERRVEALKTINVLRQAFFICLMGMAAGITINAASKNPLPYWRIPVNQEEIWPVVDADEVMLRTEEGSAIVLDAREAKEYQLGHLPGAINLPTSWAFTPERTFKSKEQLTVLAEAAVGPDRSREIITYCDTGQCCPTWALILREILGYPNVRLYDGALQEWMHDPQAPVIK